MTRKEDQTFDCKSIQINPKGLLTTITFGNGSVNAVACRRQAQKTNHKCFMVFLTIIKAKCSKAVTILFERIES